MNTRREFLADICRYLVAGIIALFAALLIGKRGTPSAQAGPCNLNIKCGNCSRNSNCPYLPAQPAARQNK